MKGRRFGIRVAATFGLLFVAASGAGRIHAQQNIASGPPLTLEAAIARALDANPSIAAARTARTVADAGVAVAGERLNPEASYEAERETPRQAIGLTLPIELGGKRGRRLDLAHATVAAIDAEIAKTVAQVRNDVRRAYFELAAAHERRAMAGELRELAVRARDAAQARLQAGDVPRLELLQTELALSDVENDLVAANSAVTAFAAELNALLAQPLSAPITLADQPTVAPVPALTDAVAGATQSNVEILLIDRRIAEQMARRSLADALRKPDLTAGGAVTYDAEPEFRTGWRASFALTVPLFTTRKAGVAVEDAELRRLQAERASLVAATTAAVTAAHVRAAAAREQVTRFDSEILPRALEVEQIAQVGYSAGQTGLPQLITALQQGRDIRRRRLEAALAYQITLAELEHAMGVPLR